MRKDQQLAGCQGKASHSTYQEAEKVVRNLSPTPRLAKRRRSKIYRCDYCRKFHIAGW